MHAAVGAIVMRAATEPDPETVQRIATRLHAELCKGTPEWKYAEACDCAVYTREVLRALNIEKMGTAHA